MIQHSTKILQTALIAVLGFLFFANTSFAQEIQVDYSGQALYVSCGNLTYNHRLASFDTNSWQYTFEACDNYGIPPPDTIPILADNLGDSNYNIFVYPTDYDTDCIEFVADGESYFNCLQEKQQGGFTISKISDMWTIPVFYGANSSLDDLIVNGEEVFYETTGSTIENNVSFVGDNFIKIIIGTALAFLFRMWSWILSIAIVSGVIYFMYKGFRFFKK